MTVFLFFDESGNFDFSSGGTRYVVFGALTTRNPAPLLRPLSDLRYDLLATGIELEAFHATEDKQAVRNRVFDIIKGVDGVELDSVIVEKAKVDPALYEVAKFYPEFAHPLLKGIFARYPDPGERIIIITDRLPLKRTKNAVEKAFKTFIRQNFGNRLFTVPPPPVVLSCLPAGCRLLHLGDLPKVAGQRVTALRRDQTSDQSGTGCSAGADATVLLRPCPNMMTPPAILSEEPHGLLLLGGYLCRSSHVARGESI